MKKYVLVLLDESKTLLLGSTLAKICGAVCVIYLNGYIGTGKSVLCRGFLRALGYKEYVKSPTYTLVESYFLSKKHIYHVDCYRLNSETELIHTGIRDYFDGQSIFLIEWPKQGINILPKPDLVITINYDNSEISRQVIIESFSNFGQIVINALLHTRNFKYEVKT